jgi:soluble lytic murein transglycosylase-like protein
MAERDLALRHNPDRRWHDRRGHERPRRNRRQRDRRRRRVRSLAFSAMTLAVPPNLSPVTLFPPQPGVSVSVDNYFAVPAPQAYDAIIHEAASTYDLDPALIRSVIETESAFNAAAVSPAGASGLMQLMPAVAAELGVGNIFDPRENVLAGAQLLRALVDRYDGNIPLVLASYNAGPAAVARYRGRIPPFRETQEYVKKVTRLWKESRHD